MKYSFIIPVYKVEKYLSKCVDSILEQTYRDFEILLVDDGSPDGSPMLCDEYANRDNRVKVLHQQNQGLGAARNNGLRQAIGEYVIFVDSDDFWGEEGCLQKIDERIFATKDGVELLFFNVSYYNDTTGNIIPWVKLPVLNECSCGNEEAFRRLVESGTVPMSAWSKVIKRSVLTENGIIFPSGIYGEDIPWFINLMEAVKSVSFMNEYIYNYRQSVTSSITNINQPKHVRDMKYIIESEIKKLDSRRLTLEGKKSVEAFLAYNYCILMSQYDYTEKAEKAAYWQFMQEYEYLLNNITHPKVKSVFKIFKIMGLKNTCRILNIYKKIR